MQSSSWHENMGRNMEHFLKNYVSHLEDKGWFDRVILAMDERSEEEMEAALNLIESIWNKEGKALKTGGYV